MMHRQYAKRQTTNTDPTAVPSVSGIDGSLTAGEPSGTKLVVGSGTGTPSTDGPDFAAGRNTIVVTSTSTSTGPPSESPTGAASPSVVKPGIQLATVIGVCIGAFIAAGLLICLSIWFYRRSSRRPPPRARQKQPLAQSRGVNPTAPWTRFDDDDRWEGRGEMTERAGPTGVALAPGMRRTTSPQPTEAARTSDDHFGSQHDVAAKSLPFAQYHPKLAEQMALEPPRPIGFGDQPKASLDGSGNGSFLSLGTVHIESGKMSPTFNVAKTTPPATASKLHHWESAEVVEPDTYAQEVEIHTDPFSEQSTPTAYSTTETFGDRRSLHNPFFNAHPGVRSRRPSVARKTSTMSVSSDPFSKGEIVMPKPRFVSHEAHDSSSSGGSVGNEKAMQSLIAALELPQDVIEERLRVASMQPSEISMYSTMDSPYEYAIPIPDTAEQGYVGQ